MKICFYDVTTKTSDVVLQWTNAKTFGHVTSSKFSWKALGTCPGLWEVKFSHKILEHAKEMPSLQCVLRVNLYVVHGGGRCSEFNKKETAISDRTRFPDTVLFPVCSNP